MESKSNDIMEKFKGLGIGGQIIVVAAIVLFIDSFLDWYSISVGFGDFKVSASASGWDAPGAIWSILAVLIALAMGGVTVARALMAPGTIPDNISGITWPKIMLGAGGVAVLCILIKLINESSNLAFGFYIGIICVVALAVGGFLMYREEMAAGG